MPANLQYSPHDLCMSIFLPLNCDGSVASETDTFTLDTALVGGENTIDVVETLDTDEVPPYGLLTLTDGTPETLGYASYTPGSPSTIQLSTGVTVAGAHTGAVVDIERSNPIIHCGLTQVRAIPLTTDEVIDSDPSGQANQNIAFRRIAPQANGYRFEADLASRENPELWALTNQYAPIQDPDEQHNLVGFEEIVAGSATCPTCGLAAATCKQVAVIMIFNAWCGQERNADFPYAALIMRDLDFEPVTENLVRGRGFNAGRILRASLRENTAFADPWGIDPRGSGVTAKWSEIAITQARIDADADLANLLSNGCGCGACPNPAVAWPTP